MTLPVPNFENVPPSNETELLTAITTTAQFVFDVDTGQGTDYPATDFVVLIEDELLFIASRAGDTFTVATIGTDGFDGRGYDGTSAALHAAETRVEAAFSARDLDNSWQAYNPDQDDQLSGLTEKTTLVDDDLFLIEDSAASGEKKKVKKVNVGGGGGGGGVPEDSVIGRLYTAPITVRGVTRTYDSDTDEFDDGAITGWTEVNGGAVKPTWFEEAHVIGADWPSTVSTGYLVAQMKAINPSADFVIETAVRWGMEDDQYALLVLADGVVAGAGLQHVVGMGGAVNSNFNTRIIDDPVTNYGNGVALTPVIHFYDHVGGFVTLTLRWDDGAGTFDYEASADGVGVLAAFSGVTPAFTPAYYGVAVFPGNASPSHASFEYFRSFTEA